MCVAQLMTAAGMDDAPTLAYLQSAEFYELEVKQPPLNGNECQGTTTHRTFPVTITDGHAHENTGVYHVNADCTFVLTTASDEYVALTIEFINIESGFDFVTIYEKDKLDLGDGTVIARLTGRNR